MTTRLAVVGFLVAIFVSLPIWFYLLYQVLVMVQATELMFFLFWIYVPASLLVQGIAQLLKGMKP